MFAKVLSFIKKALDLVSKAAYAIINFVLLLIVYFIALSIVSLISKAFGKHFLEVKIQKKKSNWQEHRLGKQTLDEYFRTF